MYCFLWTVVSLLIGIRAFHTVSEEDGKVVGGTNGSIGEYPYQLSLNTSDSYCGASIISADWALTAAHCFMFSDGPITVRAGSSYRNWGGTVHTSSEIHIHEKFNNKTTDYDIAVVKVTPPFPIGTPNVAVVKLPSSEPSAGTLTTVSGYGAKRIFNSSQSTNLLSANITIRNRVRCTLVSTVFWNRFTERMICASAHSRTSCFGDSGGPLVNPATGEQVGIVSYGLTRLCIPTMLDFYTNVANLRDWVKNITGI